MRDRQIADERVRTGERILRSARCMDSPVTPLAEVDEWLETHLERGRFVVDRIPFDRLRQWHFEETTGNLAHDSGRFFTVEGITVHTSANAWMQPIIVQPEVGVLGLLAREFDGVLHFLMQAKMEPGNLRQVQLAPTVQATRSNYTGVHGGSGVPYLEHFAAGWSDRVLVDVLQSEQSSWFLHKRNRNMIVEVVDDVPAREAFRWLTLGQIWQLLSRDDLVNMDARTVLSCVPIGPSRGPTVASSPFGQAVVESFDPESPAMHGDGELLSWLTEQRARRELVQRRVPLNRGPDHGWRRWVDRITHDSGRYFEVIAVDIRAGTREVTTWTQPLLEPIGQGLLALIVKPIGGVLHALVHTRLDAGSLNGAELAASVHCTPRNHAHLPQERQPLFLADVLGADLRNIRYDVTQSEEGGRFFHASNRYLVVEVGEEFPVDVPDEYRWMALRQLGDLLKHSNYLNVELRSLLACLHTLT